MKVALLSQENEAISRVKDVLKKKLEWYEKNRP